MRIYVPFKVWETPDKVAFVAGIALYLLLIISGICTLKSDFTIGAIFFWGGILGMMVHAYIASRLFYRDV
jgi:hypothetical protein